MMPSYYIYAMIVLKIDRSAACSQGRSLHSCVSTWQGDKVGTACQKVLLHIAALLESYDVGASANMHFSGNLFVNPQQIEQE